MKIVYAELKKMWRAGQGGAGERWTERDAKEMTIGYAVCAGCQLIRMHILASCLYCFILLFFQFFFLLSFRRIFE